MQTDAISFLQPRITNIGTALFFSENILPFPAYIITALKADDEGCIWFFIGKDQGKIVSPDLVFPSDLEFYRKGYAYTIRIKGQASIVNDKKILHDLLGKGIPVKEEILAGMSLIKVKIESAEYKELVARKKYNHHLQTILSAIKDLWYPVHPQLQPSI
ncbi:MAG TPA: hypothetical protein VKI61_16595 [Chitinophagaceae bacterium]|jgi:hypothetical protein|nr:hypothetical protein [Chitinophagaceae bacterium]